MCAKGKHPWSSVYCFLLAGLRVSGFEPALDTCSSCGSREFPSGKRARTAFSHQEGGVLCTRCGKGASVQMWLSRGALDTLRHLRRLGLPESARVELPASLEREVRGFLRQYCEFTFERRFRMLK